ncbi:hypothetical protein LG195_20530, partial [Proteus terrae]|uniref:hypothetical protein n=1 Tax=Proteus terrae TaxID=1574161 RepID=UPI00207C76AD
IFKKTNHLRLVFLYLKFAWCKTPIRFTLVKIQFSPISDGNLEPTVNGQIIKFKSTNEHIEADILLCFDPIFYI